MFGSDKDRLGILLSDDILKIVHMRLSSSGHTVANVFRKDIQGVAPEELPKVLKGALAELNVKRVKAVCVIPSSVATTKNIEIPSLDPQEIKSIIDLQAGRHTPYSREEILMGYISIGEYQRNYTQVLLIIVNRNVIKNHLGIFELAGIKVENVFFAPEGIGRFYGKALGLKENDLPVGIIDISKKSTDFIITFHNTIITCRSIPLGMEHLLKEGLEARDKLISEVEKSIESYKSEDINRPPDIYYLTSDDAKIKELQPFLREKIKANVKILPFLDHVKAGQPVLLKIVSEFDDDSFLDLVSSVIFSDNAQVDLLPEEIKQQCAMEDQAHQLVKAGTFVLVLLLVICGIFITKIYFNSIYLGKLSQEYERKHQEVEKIDKIASNTRIVKDYLNSRMVSLKVMNELYRHVPNEMYLKNVMLEEGGTIKIEGTSDSMSLVFNLVSALEDSELFKAVKTKSTAAKKERGKDVAVFEISLRLESAPDEKEEVETKAEESAEAKGPEK